MKIIDVLNKIANGEEVPKWVVYDKKEYIYMEEYKDYVYEVYNNGTMLFLLSEIFNKNGIDIVLNQELDFIEEDKKIEKWNEFAIQEMLNEKDIENIKGYIEIIMKTQNEIIDYLNKEKE